MANDKTKYRLDFYRAKTLTHQFIGLRRPKTPHKTLTPVVCENTGQEFESIKAAAEWFGIPAGSVSISVRDGRRNYTGINYKGLAFDYKPVF